jgi:hypothetical protein
LFRNPPVILKTVPKAGYECTLENIDQLEQRKAGTEIYAACGTIFRITVVSVFTEASENFILIFLLN